MDNMRKLLNDMAIKAQEQERDQIVEVMIKMLSALYDKAMAYTNLIIVAGYAAFFTIWSFMRPYLSRSEMLATALCISISCILFVAWEIAKMIVSEITTRKLQQVISAPPNKIKDELSKHQKSEQRLQIRLHNIWIVVLGVTIFPGFIGAGILVYSFIRQLFAV